MSFNTTIRRNAVAFVVVVSLMPISTAFAQTTAPATKKPNFIQRHPTATGLVAGVATHSALKHSAAQKKARHQKLNFAEKHPTITGIAAGMGTKAVVKKSTPH